MGGFSKEGQHPSTGPPTYQIIKVTNAKHMSMMKTSLTVIPMCPREHFALYKSSFRLVLCYKKDWTTLLHLSYSCYLLSVTNYLITQLSVTDNFSSCREYLAKNRLSFPSAPHWVWHSYLSKGLWLIPYTCGSSGPDWWAVKTWRPKTAPCPDWTLLGMEGKLGVRLWRSLLM